jgi:8-oxo-dGTP pyrophosphatase MutT (NUDIX family)
VTIALRESCMQQPNAEKVTAFVTRATPQGMHLLIFEHPRAGFQLPAGTVEANEPHAKAAAREAREETGLRDLPPGRLLRTVQETLPDDHFLITTTTRVYARPDLTSFDWASIRNGFLVWVHHVGPAFAHVTYAERDPHTEPAVVSFQITGWVPTGVITRQVTRFFYHFPYQGQTPVTWSVDTDNHRFRLFWAPLYQLPPIVAWQRWWIDILTQALATT